jgi:hypothetical protein
MNQMKTGFFTMETVNSVMRLKTLEEAKQYAHKKVDEKTSAQQYNIDKAKAMIDKSTSIQSLAIAIANFMLAHPSENLKTIR